MDECTLRCETCGVDLGAALYETDDDHEAAGLLVGMRLLHEKRYSDHVLILSRETHEEAEARRETEAQAAREAMLVDAGILQKRLEESAARHRAMAAAAEGR